MPTIPLHPRPLYPSSPAENPLPNLLHTPSGLALLELQGTFHFPPSTAATASTQVGKLVFPHYNPTLNDPNDTKWMKRVYLYVGKGQRLTGECKKLGRPFAVVRKRERGSGNEDTIMRGNEEEGQEMEKEASGVEDELEIVEIVRFKIVFSNRPEPVSGGEEVG